MVKEVIEKDSKLWEYLPKEIKGLISDGEQLLSLVDSSSGKVSDYSYLVFPFAKAYEGFLKRLFLDVGVIKEDEYYGERIRIGRLLNPFYEDKKRSAYEGLARHKRGSKDISERLWRIWRKGRNQVFHYFPHNFRHLQYDEALDIIQEIVGSMTEAVDLLIE